MNILRRVPQRTTDPNRDPNDHRYWTTENEIRFLRGLGMHRYVGDKKTSRIYDPNHRLNLLRNYQSTLNGDVPRRWDDGVDVSAIRGELTKLIALAEQIVDVQSSKLEVQ